MSDLNKTLDLRKEKVLDLKKTVGLRNQKASVILALDYSGSMNTLYKNGSVQELVERILPLGLAFDDNGEVDFYLFETGVKKMPENITISNVQNYVNKKVIGKYNMGGTEYAPVINKIVADFTPKKGGLFGIGGSKEYTFDYPVYVIFITDGENSDKKSAESAIIEASKYGIFFQFVGIGSEQFNFLQKLDNLSNRNIDNANFFKIQNIAAKTDDELYALLLTEFPSFVFDARVKNLIK